ncbi:MAG: hypothetical protein HRT34_10775, partial [Alcanivorax sp.]|nr:hypothetical protein [Alcanivorax sp.]
MANTSLEKDKIRILLLEGVHQNSVDNLKAHGYSNVELLPTALTGDDLKDAIKDAHFVGIRSRTQLTEEVFQAAEKLIGVGCFCIGTNQVDLKAALKRGIPVFNAPYSNTRSVAELVIAHTVNLMRGIPEKNAVAHRGGWLKSAKDSYEIRGKKLGIVDVGDGAMPLVTAALKDAGLVVNEDVELVVDLAPGAGCVEGDPHQLEQVVVNVAVNARDAMPDGGKITMRTSRTRTELNGLIREWVVLMVEDTGTGMDDATRKKALEPFFTTKEQGKGTGLGLATVD